MNACTIVARNYLAYARVLADSFFEHHPGGSFHVLVTDDLERTIDDAAERFHIVRLDEIGLPTDEWHRMAAIYDVMELATGIKPFLLRHLLGGGLEDATYFDPDIEIHAALNDLSALARQHGIVLTPHSTQPMPRDGRWPDELTILTSGVYNLGFISVSPVASAFLDWWCERLRRDSLSLKEEGYFVDQRWIDFVPTYFHHHQLIDPGCNVAYWNLAARRVSRDALGWYVDGDPLRFFHYSGFDATRPWLLSKFQADRPRILLSESPAVAELCRNYARKVLAAGHEMLRSTPYALNTTPSGISLDHRMRRFYREALIRAEAAMVNLPPDPFDSAQSDAFRTWLSSPATETQSVGRYLTALWHESRDLQLRFPDVQVEDANAYVDWVRAEGARVSSVAWEIVPSGRVTSALRRRTSDAGTAAGYNLVGYVRAESGVGEVARLVRRGIERAGLPYALIPYDEAPQRQLLAVAGEPEGTAKYDTNVLTINADQTPSFAHQAGQEFFAGRYTVGLWAWEVEPFPEKFHGAFDCVDEIWAHSEYSATVIRQNSPVPVFRVPMAVAASDARTLPGRDSLGLPEGFIFHFSFDFFSIVERKNPKGLIAAFRRAFAPASGPILVIKTINGDRHVAQLEELRALASDRSDIIIRDEYLSPSENAGMMAACSCYVSLHRSEGFGLSLAEAMAMGKPVIATRHSGNLTFMDDESAFLVDCSMADVPVGCEPYPPGSRWANPNLETAARLMQRVVSDPAETHRRAAVGRERVQREQSVDAAAAFLTTRFEAIHAPGPPGKISVSARKGQHQRTNRETMKEFSRRVARRAVRSPLGTAAKRAIRHVVGAETAVMHDAIEQQARRLTTFQDEARRQQEAIQRRLERVEARVGEVSPPQ